MSVWLNDGPDPNFSTGWKFKEIGSIASGLGPGKNVRIADIDGDGVSAASSPQKKNEKTTDRELDANRSWPVR